METTLKLEVYRRLDNRLEGLSDESPRALELHYRRKDALREILDSEPLIQVTDWGDTDDTNPHELVEIALGAASTAAIQYVIVPGVKWLGRKLVEKAIDTALSELTKAIVAKLRPKQEAKEILDFTVNLPDGTQIIVDTPDRNSSITIHFSDGEVQSINYSTHST